jgi:hypothetical protein
MGKFYIDDSVHFEANFIIGACVYSEEDNLNQIIEEVVRNNGFDPATFEYKSSANYSKEPGKAKIRESLKVVLRETCKLGIVVIPANYRDQLGKECIKAVVQFLKVNELLNQPNEVYVDQGMFTNKKNAEDYALSYGLPDCTFHLEQDSKIIRGIQLADLAAHVCSIQMKDAMGLVKKMVKCGPDSGYEIDSEMELGFEMFATVRYVFFNKGTTEVSEDIIKMATVQVEPYGLYISDLCNEDLKQLVIDHFGEVYLGCIH